MHSQTVRTCSKGNFRFTEWKDSRQCHGPIFFIPCLAPLFLAKGAVWSCCFPPGAQSGKFFEAPRYRADRAQRPLAGTAAAGGFLTMAGADATAGTISSLISGSQAPKGQRFSRPNSLGIVGCYALACLATSAGEFSEAGENSLLAMLS